MITFYSASDAFGVFSNFSPHPVTIYDRTWQTSEHAYQAMKFHPHRPDLVAMIHKAPYPGVSARLGRDPSYPLRKGWDSNPRTHVLEQRFPESLPMEVIDAIPQPDDLVDRGRRVVEPLFTRVKDVVMYEVCLAKFNQHEDLAKVLRTTGDQAIVEDARYDSYWGWGSHKKGDNKLGRILMAVRRTLRAEGP